MERDARLLLRNPPKLPMLRGQAGRASGHPSVRSRRPVSDHHPAACGLPFAVGAHSLAPLPGRKTSLLDSFVLQTSTAALPLHLFHP